MKSTSTTSPSFGYIKKVGPDCFPAPFARAIANDNYDPGIGDFTVTQLLSPPQRTFLATLPDVVKIESGYAKTMSVFGSGVHNVLEHNVDKGSGEFAEVRFYWDFDIAGHGKVKVGGKLDLYIPNEVHDWKVTSQVQEEAKPEHRDQAQMNGLLTKRNGHPVGVVVVNYMDRAWSYMQSVVNPAYPSSAFTAFCFDFDENYAQRRFEQTIKDHLQARAGKPRPCTDDERWKKGDRFALKKPGAKRASRVYDTLKEAQENQSAGQFIETRPGEATFCTYFCGYGHCCPQHQAEIAKNPPVEDSVDGTP